MKSSGDDHAYGSGEISWRKHTLATKQQHIYIDSVLSSHPPHYQQAGSLNSPESHFICRSTSGGRVFAGCCIHANSLAIRPMEPQRISSHWKSNIFERMCLCPILISVSRMHCACLKTLPGYSQVVGQSDERQSPGVEAPGKLRQRAGRKPALHCTPAGADRLIAQDRVPQPAD